MLATTIKVLLTFKPLRRENRCNPQPPPRGPGFGCTLYKWNRVWLYIVQGVPDSVVQGVPDLVVQIIKSKYYGVGWFKGAKKKKMGWEVIMTSDQKEYIFVLIERGSFLFCQK
mgnify:CR=1 FL=1